MNVAFDASAILGRSGIERYSRELIKGLDRNALADQLTLLVDAHDGGRTAQYFKEYRRVEVHECLPHERKLGAPLRPLMRVVRRAAMTRGAHQADVFHLLAPGKVVPGKRPILTTIHDLFPMDPAMRLEGHLVRRFPGRVRRHLEASDAIVCPSAYVASTVREQFPWYRGPIHVTPLAAGDEFYPDPISPPVATRHGIAKPYLLFVGRLDPRKNLSAMMAAWNTLPLHLRNECEFVLIIAAAANDIEGFKTENAEAFRHPSIRVIHDVSSASLVQLLSSARALAFATLGEGFGLPVIEAMRCGCPVITSHNTSLPEVGGDAALYVDPLDTEDISDAMRRCLVDDDLVAGMRTRGLVHSSAYTWDATARATAAVYRSLTAR